MKLITERGKCALLLSFFSSRKWLSCHVLNGGWCRVSTNSYGSSYSQSVPSTWMYLLARRKVDVSLCGLCVWRTTFSSATICNEWKWRTARHNIAVINVIYNKHQQQHQPKQTQATATEQQHYQQSEAVECQKICYVSFGQSIRAPFVDSLLFASLFAQVVNY